MNLTEKEIKPYGCVYYFKQAKSERFGQNLLSNENLTWGTPRQQIRQWFSTTLPQETLRWWFRHDGIHHPFPLFSGYLENTLNFTTGWAESTDKLAEPTRPSPAYARTHRQSDGWLSLVGDGRTKTSPSTIYLCPPLTIWRARLPVGRNRMVCMYVSTCRRGGRQRVKKCVVVCSAFFSRSLFGEEVMVQAFYARPHKSSKRAAVCWRVSPPSSPDHPDCSGLPRKAAAARSMRGRSYRCRQQ